MDTVLVTGGLGYIGSHVVVDLLDNDFDVVIVDSLINSSISVLNRIKSITGCNPSFYCGDVRDLEFLKIVFSNHNVSYVMHFAGLKSVSESNKFPLDYFDNNVFGAISLCKAMSLGGVFKLIFSSSATVYGEPCELPIPETHHTAVPTNPYGRSKLFIEQILQDLIHSDDRWSIGVLRYFNPAGAHKSGLIGESPQGIPNNLLPYVMKVAVGRLKEVIVFGNDYLTCDGTGVRDFVHVVDLASGHLKALKALEKKNGLNVWNLGAGQGYSVLELIKMCEFVTESNIPFKIGERRTGDVASCWADISKANNELDWYPKYSFKDMIKDSWNWQLNNPDGL
jgi:UDP-glucose 4-epimerase